MVDMGEVATFKNSQGTKAWAIIPDSSHWVPRNQGNSQGEMNSSIKNGKIANIKENFTAVFTKPVICPGLIVANF